MCCILVNVDGGICSQMQQYSMGRLLAKQGKRVCYDLSFYHYGRDIYGQDVRNFDLLKAFPSLSFPTTSSWRLKLYHRFFRHDGQYPKVTDEDWTQFKAPMFMSGYYREVAEMYEDYQTLFKIDPQVLDPRNSDIYHSIPDNAVAIHVRRGDLSTYQEAYGHPATIGYFKEAIELLEQRFGRLEYYIFSDGMEYVKQELLPVLSEETHYHLVENDAAHGYFDLIHMSRCRHHICSKGSLAKFAACLSTQEGVAITIKDDTQLGPLAFTGKEVISI